MRCDIHRIGHAGKQNATNRGLLRNCKSSDKKGAANERRSKRRN